MIREFFYNIYTSLAHHDIWPFKTISLNVIESKLLVYQNESGISFTLTEKLQFTYRLAVVTVRYQQKKFVQSISNVIEIPPMIINHLLNVGGSLLDNMLRKNREMEEIYTIYIYITYPNTLLFKNEQLITDIVLWHEKKETNAHLLVSDLLKKLLLAFPKLDLSELHSSYELRYKLIAVANYALLYQNLNVDLDFDSRWDRRFQSLSIISLEKPVFTKVLWDIIVNINSHSKIPLINPSQIFYLIYSIFNQYIDLKVFETSINIKIILEVGYLIEEEFLNTINNLLPHKANLFTSKDEKHKDIVYDLVISDLEFLVSLDLNSTKKYVLRYPPAERDLSNIKKIVDEISISKLLIMN